MNERCTCGTYLVDDAVFCHKCGRPVRDDLIARDVIQAVLGEPPPPLPSTVPIEAATAAAAQPSVHDIGFHNPAAVRISLAVAAISFLAVQLLQLFPGGPLLVIPAMVLIGFACVIFYCRQTGAVLSTISGARLGWLSGLFFFIIVLVIIALGAAVAMLTEGGFVDIFRKAMIDNPAATAESKAIFEKYGSDEFATLLLFVLALLFVLLTVLPSVGGMLGARFLRPRNNH